MHRTLPKSRTALAAVFLGWAWAGAAGLRAADEPIPPPRPEPAPAAVKGNQIVVAVGSSQRLQMKGKKVIASVINPKENIAFVQPVQEDPRTVVITGRESGITRITLTAADGTEETYEVVVQFDVEYLRSVLVRAVPTASLQLIPGASGVIIIGGNVEHSEDIDVIMRTAQSVVAQPDRIVNAMRVGPVMQIQLDCVVAYVSRDELRRMSFDFLNVGHHHVLSSTVGGALINPNIGSTLPTAVAPNLGAGIQNIVGTPNGEAANLFLGLFNDEQVFFGLLQALRDDSIVKILAEPKLVTMSGRSANLLSGGEQAIPESAGLGSISVRFEPFGTQLSFLPIVLGNGRIHLEVEPEVSNLDPTVGTTVSGTSVPGRKTQRVHTTVEMNDGQTLAIGGLIQTDVLGVTRKVPVLGDLPFLGAAFSRKSYEEREQELVVLVTPHLVDAMACNQVPKLLPSQETRSPDDFELFLEGILEAPRGQRETCPGGRYQAAYKNGPTASVYPCGANGCGANGCGSGGPGCAACEGAGQPAGDAGTMGDHGKPGSNYGREGGHVFVLPSNSGPAGPEGK